MTEQPLWSERHGGTLPLTNEGFAVLLTRVFARLKEEGYFAEVLRWGIRDQFLAMVQHEVAPEFFSMKLGDPWPASAMTSAVSLEYTKREKIYDLIELLHRDVVSQPDESQTTFDREAGRAVFRERINPVLGRCDPALELTERGIIEEQVAEPFRRLVEQPLPQDAPKREVADRVADAIAHFKRRGASLGDRRAAARELADVLEFVRKDVQLHMLKKDEADLFRIANEFALRHNKPDTRRDFEEAVWLSWAFYVYLATIRLVLELKRRSEAASP